MHAFLGGNGGRDDKIKTIAKVVNINHEWRST